MNLQPQPFIVMVLILGSLIWLWVSASRAREYALHACKRFCKQTDVQLLDYTVALQKLRPARDRAGRFCWRRYYQFEFSVDGAQRFPGRVVLNGAVLLRCELHMPDGTTLVSPEPGSPAGESNVRYLN